MNGAMVLMKVASREPSVSNERIRRMSKAFFVHSFGSWVRVLIYDALFEEPEQYSALEPLEIVEISLFELPQLIADTMPVKMWNNYDILGEKIYPHWMFN